MSSEGFWRLQTPDPSSEEVGCQSQSLGGSEADNELSDSVSTHSLLVDQELDATPTVQHTGPPRKKENKLFKDTWRKEYLMYPTSSDSMQCIVCGAVLSSFKTSMIKLCVECHHEHSLTFSESKKTFLIEKFESKKSKQKKCMDKALTPSQAVAVAPYKLAFMITKHKMPFTTCESIELYERVLQTELKQLVEQSPF